MPNLIDGQGYGFACLCGQHVPTLPPPPAPPPPLLPVPVEFNMSLPHLSSNSSLGPYIGATGSVGTALNTYFASHAVLYNTSRGTTTFEVLAPLAAAHNVTVPQIRGQVSSCGTPAACLHC